MGMLVAKSEPCFGDVGGDHDLPDTWRGSVENLLLVDRGHQRMQWDDARFTWQKNKTDLVFFQGAHRQFCVSCVRFFFYVFLSKRVSYSSHQI